MAKKYQYHKDHTEPTNPKAILVFGSNLSAIHGGGAAALAERKYGASRKIAEGLSGNSYALPTKDEEIETLPLDDIKGRVKTFLKFARANPGEDIFMTRVGCVLAGYKDHQIAPMFKGAPTNINFPEEWEEFLEA